MLDLDPVFERFRFGTGLISNVVYGTVTLDTFEKCSRGNINNQNALSFPYQDLEM